MRKLIKYELQVRKFGWLIFLLGIIGWDFAWIYNFYRFDIDQIGLQFSLIFLSVLSFLLPILLLFTNLSYFYHYFQTNNFSHLQSYPTKAWKILLSKLMLVILEYLCLILVQFAVILLFYKFSIHQLMIRNPLLFKVSQPDRLILPSIFRVNFFIFFLYMISILVLFLFILFIKKAAQSSKTFFWLTILSFVVYFFSLVMIIIKYYQVTLASKIPQTYYFSFQFFANWFLIFFPICIVLCYFIYWFYTRRTDF